jgi:hypothetical protein
MSKKLIELNSMDRIKEELKRKHECYVLITCTSPTGKGEMSVEMNYEGDDMLAAFLVDNASQIFDEKISRAESK